MAFGIKIYNSKPTSRTTSDQAVGKDPSSRIRTTKKSINDFIQRTFDHFKNEQSSSDEDYMYLNTKEIQDLTKAEE